MRAQAFDDAFPTPEVFDLEKAHQEIALYNHARTTVARRVTRRFRLVVLPVVILVAVWALFFVTQGASLLRPPGGQIVTAILVAFAISVCLLVMFLALEPAGVLQNAFLVKLLPLLFSFAQGISHYRGGQPALVDRIAEQKLVSFFRSEHGGTVSGTFEGYAFVITEAELISGKIELAGVRKTITPFTGIILQMTRAKAFPGRLLIRDRRSSALTAPVPAWPSRAGTLSTGHAAIDERYVLSVEPEELEQRPLSPDDIASLAAFCDIPMMRGADIAIIDRDCFVFLPTSCKVFDPPTIREDFDYDRHAVPMIESMSIFLRALRLAAMIGEPAILPSGS